MAGMLFPVALRKEIKKLINIDVVGLPANPTDADIQRIKEKRPDFLFEIEHHNEVFHKSWLR